ncbi:MAG: TetR/AcrR family transcriptional regulator [Spongiibacteraceae bacterium]|jgi:AcrR family transcriptional regulator|nr:TetR/AcrR family transcriptional regulator [Spongiibacteraceae bacterium]
MPKRVNHAERRAMIASAAASCIAEVGLDGASLRVIAQRCGVSKGIVEHYFKSREAVIAAALEQMNARYLAREEQLTAGLRGLDALRARLRCILPLDDESRQEWKIRLCFWGLAAIDPAAREAQQTRLALTRERYRQDLAQACEDGSIAPPVSLVSAAMDLSLFMAGASCGALLDPDAYTQTYLQQLINRTLAQLEEEICA